MTEQNKRLFLDAVKSAEVAEVKEMLRSMPDLAKVDLRPTDSQDHFTNGYALFQACRMGHLELAKILLEHGAHPDAPSTEIEDPPEGGKPICFAVEQEHFALANLLLDHSASVYAFGYCDKPMFEKLYEKAVSAGVDPNTVRRGFQNYLYERIKLPKDADHEVIQLYYRMLELGVEPSLSTIVRDEQMELIQDLLESCSLFPAPKLSYPRGSFLENFIYSASWFGYPDILELCMTICGDYYKTDFAWWSIDRAVQSHNRDGSTEDYIQLISYQLDYLNERNKLNWIKNEKPLYPFHLLAKSFLNKDTYGYKAPLQGASDIIAVADLFLKYGFDDHASKRDKDGLTAIEVATTRLDCNGMNEYIEYLNSLDK